MDPKPDHAQTATGEATPLDRVSKRFSPILQFIRTELFGSLLLVVVTIAALVWANSPASASYFGLVHSELSIVYEGVQWTHTLQEWVNDALMTLFFFLIGLEIKRELVTGRLQNLRSVALPAFAAIGGMVVPGAFYIALNHDGPASHGWAVPMATDIAFALGVLGLVGRRAPVELRLFLLSLAIIDDIGAIALIAAFFSEGIAWGWLGGLAAVPLVLWFMQWFGVEKVYLYVPVGIAAWVCALMSGVHPTIAGVIVAVMTPARPIRGRPVLYELEHFLHPWVAFVVVPVFAFANAGVSLDWSNLDDALNRQVTWGIALGLVLGKTLGVAGFAWLGLKLRVGGLPEGVRMKHIVAMAPLTGIAFTVGLVMATLSFDHTPRLDAAKIGLLGASLVAALAGGIAVYLTTRNDPRAS